MTKSLDTLVEDIYELFNPKVLHEPKEENLDTFANNLKDLLRVRLSSREDPDSPLRFSSLGKPDRQIWFKAHPDKDNPPEELSGKTFFKFLYGDIIEQIILFLAAESGHVVERAQEEIEVDGVKGHIDAFIDGVLVDVKSASPYGYKKFKEHTLIEQDPFGYVAQLSGYANVLTPGVAPAFVAFDKVSGDICVMPLSVSITEQHKPEQKIAHQKEVIASENIPPLCYDPVPSGKSGNMELPTTCSYCADKFRCHPGIRAFAYSTGPKYLTRVVEQPRVPEIERKKR